ncbi:MAG: DNA-binding protein [Steroidobacteraceae bacterium]
MSTTPAGPAATESPAARRSAPISREAVFDAAWALTKAGSRPTIERIRLYLGNGTPRGSPVNTFLTQWWEQLAVRVAGEPMEAIHGLPPSVSATLETLWSQALVATREKWRDELARRSEAERTDLARRFDAAEARLLRELDQARQLARERAQEARRAVTEARAATRERDRLQRELVKAQAKRLARPAKPATQRPRKRTKAPVKPW